MDDLPDSLEALVAAEIDVLSPFPRLLLGYASVLGRSFNPLVWERLLVDDGIEIDEPTTAQIKPFVAFEPGGVARFRQAVVRDVAYRGLPYRRRQVLHLRAGQVDGGGGRRGGRLRRRPPVASTSSRAATTSGRGATPAWPGPGPRSRTPTSTRRRSTGARSRPADGCPTSRAEEHRVTWTALGDVLEQAGLPMEALEAYRRAIAARPRGRRRVGPPGAQASAGAGAVGLVRHRAARAADGGAAPARRSTGDEAARVRVAAATMRAIVHEGQEQPRRALRRRRAGGGGGRGDRGPARAGPGLQRDRLGPRVGRATSTGPCTSRGSWRSTTTLGEPHRAAAALGQPGGGPVLAGPAGTRRSTATSRPTRPTSSPATS